jgi:CheY-like chemotaxis protein
MSSSNKQFSHKIVVAEDTPDIRMLLVLQLKMLGFTVFEAEDGLHAVELAREITPDLILMDLSMPVMNGLEATRIIKEDQLLGSVKIVAFTALSTMENRQEAFAAGCDDFVEKDLEFSKIRDLMCRVLPN